LLRGPRVDGPLGESSDAREDLVCGFSPDERLRIVVMRMDEFLNAGF